MNKSQSERLAFWTRFNEVIIERGRPFNVRKASTDHWYDVAIGTSAAHLGITLVNKENCIGIELYISDDKSIFSWFVIGPPSLATLHFMYFLKIWVTLRVTIRIT